MTQRQIFMVLLGGLAIIMVHVAVAVARVLAKLWHRRSIGARLLRLFGRREFTGGAHIRVWLNGEEHKHVVKATVPLRANVEGWGLFRVVTVDEDGYIVMRDNRPVFAWRFGRVKWSPRGATWKARSTLR